MKKVLLAALAASSALIAMPAAAQTVTGTITLTGSVAPKCFVLPGAGSTFSDSVDFGELAAADGTLRTGLAADFDAGVADFRVLCTSGNPDITIDADPLVADTATAGGAGYADTIHYVAHVRFDQVGGASETFDNDTHDPVTSDTLAGQLRGTGDNIVITADGFATPAVGDVLVADDYEGQIVVTIAPGT